MSSILDQAQNFSGGVISAARQRDRWARREANATDSEEREQYREAIADLEARYPDLEDVPVGGAEAFARERGHGTGARSPVHEGRRRGGRRSSSSSSSSKRDKPRAGEGKPRAVPGLTPGAKRGGRSSAGTTPHVDRAIRQTGIPAALSSSSSTLMAGLGATVGAALLYLVISSAEKPGTGAAATPTVVKAITGALGRFISTKDFFPGSDPAGGGASSPGPSQMAHVEREADRIGGRGRQPKTPHRHHRRRKHR